METSATINKGVKMESAFDSCFEHPLRESLDNKKICDVPIKSQATLEETTFHETSQEQISDSLIDFIQNCGNGKETKVIKYTKMEHEVDFSFGCTLPKSTELPDSKDIKDFPMKSQKSGHTEKIVLPFNDPDREIIRKQKFVCLFCNKNACVTSNTLGTKKPFQKIVGFNRPLKSSSSDIVDVNVTRSRKSRNNILATDSPLKIVECDKDIDHANHQTHPLKKSKVNNLSQVSYSKIYKPLSSSECLNFFNKHEILNCCKTNENVSINGPLKKDESGIKLNSVYSDKLLKEKSELIKGTKLAKCFDGKILTLDPSELGYLKEKQFMKLISCVPIEISNDFCLKFGHSEICPYGSLCKFKNKDICSICKLYCIPRNDSIGKTEHENYCQFQEKVKMKLDTSVNYNVPFRAQTCELCKKTVSISGTISSRYYGILVNCEHVFCLKCAERCANLRNGGDHQFPCHVCGTYSPFYVASNVWIEKKDKQNFFKIHKKSLETLRCSLCNANSNSKIAQCPCFDKRAIFSGNKIVQNMVNHTFD